MNPVGLVEVKGQWGSTEVKHWTCANSMQRRESDESQALKMIASNFVDYDSFLGRRCKVCKGYYIQIKTASIVLVKS